MAWSLATSRILGRDPRLTNREVFVQELHARGVVADSTRISRWESGSQRVRDNVIEAYESILGLPPRSILAQAANLRRTHGVEQEVRETETDDETLDHLFEQVLSDETTGSTWLELAIRVTGFERIYLAPAMRTTLCDKLLRELQLATGHAQSTRTAAANMLMDNPSARRPMSRSIGAHILNSDAQVFRPAMLLLQHVADDSVGNLALRLMSNDRATLSMAASGVVAVKLSQGHYEGESLAGIERHILKGFGAPRNGSRVLDALDLIGRLPDASFDRVWPHISDERIRHRVRLVRETGELQLPEVSREIARNVASLTQSSTPAPFAQEPDQMLIRLIREALFHSRHQRRQQASQLLEASPYADAIASACLKLVSDDSSFVAARAWDLLSHLGQHQDGERLAGTALAETRRDPQLRGLMAVGMRAEPLNEEHTRQITRLAWHDSPDVQHAAMFVLGMTGSPELEQLLRHPSNRQKRAAAWWLDVGSAVTDQEFAQRGASAN